jgi:hypothetical protein
MTDLLSFVASGAVFYVLLGALSTVVLYFVWKLPHIVKAALTPVIWFMGWVGRSPVGVWIKQRRWWLWLEKQELDPPARPLSWWVTRGLLVLALWAGSLAWALEHGKETGAEAKAPTRVKNAYRKPVAPAKDWWE